MWFINKTTESPHVTAIWSIDGVHSCCGLHEEKPQQCAQLDVLEGWKHEPRKPTWFLSSTKQSSN